MKRATQMINGSTPNPQAAVTPLSLVRRVEGGPGVSLVNKAEASLRRAALAAGPGAFLGSEEQLIEALGVSRPTFRQATKLLRHENLLNIKRGMGGGFFTMAPSEEAVTRMAAIYLNAQGTSMQQLNDVMAPLQAAAARQLAMHPDPSVRACLSEFLETHRNSSLPESERNPIVRALKFERLLGEKAGNPAIALVMNVMRDLVRDERRVHYLLRPDRLTNYENYQTRLAQAILDGDPEMASLICERHTAQFRQWTPDARVESDLSIAA